MIDFGGPWCCKPMGQTDLLRVVEKLRSFETMKWSAIMGHNNHSVPIERLSPEAQDRLMDLKRDEVEEVFSLRITGRERVIGIRQDNVLHLLWWDPKHEVCPSTKYRQ